MSLDVVVLGGGAAGLMAARVAAQRGRKTLLIEHNAVVGEKIRISGGGRCNFTNTGASPANYLSSNPRFCTSALARYTPADFIALVERHGIAYHEKKLGQLFCDGSAQAIIQMLLDEVTGAGGVVHVGERVGTVVREEEGFTVSTSRATYHTRNVIVATGGLSIPKLGATGLGYYLAQQFEVPVIPPRPALVPLTWQMENFGQFADLSGLSCDCVATFGKTRFRENCLFTHRGLSGPAVLQISSYWDGAQSITFDLAPERNLGEWLRSEKRAGNRSELKTLLTQLFPSRLAERWCTLLRAQGPVNQMKDATLDAVARGLHHWTVQPGGTEGYKKAEVTAGGVDTRALDPKTMAVKTMPGLHFIGEVVDVTGWLGGYNFQWAWASGHAAGTAV
jgi:predicted Rossmann fold flavoprotein